MSSLDAEVHASGRYESSAQGGQTEDTPKHHLLISGVGRSGTSFLVRYLAGLGLQTHLDVHTRPQWFEEANAGLEDLPIYSPGCRLPYVIKSPWLCEIVDQVLTDPELRIDAVILPMRDLAEAATSRVVMERQNIHQSTIAKIAVDHIWENWCHTPGGIVFSLNPVDQGRLLAVWFYQLVERLTKAAIPIVFLTFPRLVEDPDYLFHTLRPWLPIAATEAKARAVHESVANVQAVRVGRELTKARSSNAEQITSPGISYSDREQLNQAALRREIARLNRTVSQLENNAETSKSQLSEYASQTDEHLRHVSELDRESKKMLALLAERSDELSRSIELQAKLHSFTDRQNEQLEKIFNSRSWRLTRPLRSLAGVIRRLFH